MNTTTLANIASLLSLLLSVIAVVFKEPELAIVFVLWAINAKIPMWKDEK